MSDSDNDDIFSKIAASKYAAQADLSDGDVEIPTKLLPKTKTKTKETKIKAKETKEDSDLEDLAAEVGAADSARIAKIREEIQKWEAVRIKARSQNVDKSRIVKVDTKIRELQEELATLTATTHQHDKEVQKLEKEIDTLEQERAAVELKLTAKTARLRELKPHVAGEDWLNDPSQLGGQIVEGKFVEDAADGEDDYMQLSNMMSERRKAAQAAGQYNSDSHVKIKNPRTRDDNVGF